MHTASSYYVRLLPTFLLRWLFFFFLQVHIVRKVACWLSFMLLSCLSVFDLKKKSITFRADMINIFLFFCYDRKHLHSKLMKTDHAFFSSLGIRGCVSRGWMVSNGSESAARSQKNVSTASASASVEKSSSFLLRGRGGELQHHSVPHPPRV